jgi:hypothetical protein
MEFEKSRLSAEPWPVDIPVPTFGPRMVCTSRGRRCPAELDGAAAPRDADRRAMALIPRRLGKNEREVLLPLADSAKGCAQSILLAHGFAIGTLRDLVAEGGREAVRAGGELSGERPR